MDEKKAYPADHPIYAKLRTLAIVAGGTFASLSIGPHSAEDGALSVNTSVESDTGDTIEMRVWRPSVASPLRLQVWNMGTGTRDFRDLGSEPPAYGLGPDGSEDIDAVLPGMPAVVAIHKAAEEAHQGLEGSGAEERTSLMRLNSAVTEGIMARELVAGDDEGFDEDDDAMGELEDLVFAAVEDTDLESLTFNGYGPGGLGLSTLATVRVAGNPVVLRVWAEDADGSPEVKASVAGSPAQMTEGGFLPGAGFWPGGSDDQERIALALESVADVHIAAQDAFVRILDEARTDAVGEFCALAVDAFHVASVQRHLAEHPIPRADLSALPALPDALELDEDDDEVWSGPDWHEAADAFTENCKLPFFGGISLQEAPDGAIDIAATVLEPVGHASVELKVYWHTPSPGSDPEHWFAVGDASGPAHVNDPGGTGLLAGFHPDSRDFISHSLEHLHAMSHYAAEVIMGKIEEAIGTLESLDEPAPELAQEHYISHEISDAIEGLNGVARLYSGSSPDWSGYPRG